MSSPLAERIQRDLVAAMKQRDDVRLSVLRMLKSAMQLAQTEKGRDGGLSDEDVQALVRRAVKQREEAAAQYRAGNAPERAAEELEEAKVLADYLPSQLGDAEMEEILRRIVGEVGATGAKDMGKVMSRAMQEIGGRADGKRVKDAVQRILP
jgi:Uncharacterized conserved protein